LILRVGTVSKRLWSENDVDRKGTFAQNAQSLKERKKKTPSDLVEKGWVGPHKCRRGRFGQNRGGSGADNAFAEKKL